MSLGYLPAGTRVAENIDGLASSASPLPEKPPQRVSFCPVFVPGFSLRIRAMCACQTGRRDQYARSPISLTGAVDQLLTFILLTWMATVQRMLTVPEGQAAQAGGHKRPLTKAEQAVLNGSKPRRCRLSCCTLRKDCWTLHQSNSGLMNKNLRE